MLKVYLSPLAEKKLSLLLDYIENEWAKKERDDFFEKILDSFNRVAIHPESCSKSQTFPDLFKCVVSKQTSFFYRYNSTDLEIITIFDNRQDPQKVKTELEKILKDA